MAHVTVTLTLDVRPERMSPEQVSCVARNWAEEQDVCTVDSVRYNPERKQLDVCLHSYPEQEDLWALLARMQVSWTRAQHSAADAL